MTDRRSPNTHPAGTKARATALFHLWCENIRGAGHDPELYALLDAARDPAIYRGLQGFAATEDIVCLYQGPTAAEMAAVAPYLVRIGPRTDVFDWLWDEGWGESWGIFIWSVATIEQLRAHFRKLTKVRTEDGKVLLFRFYDPDVLSIFLPTCTPAQIEEMFGPVMRFFMEASDGAAIEEYSHAAGVLRRRLLKLRRCASGV
jgi:hypothetical protein